MTREEFRDFQAALDKLVDLAVDNNKSSLPPNLDEAVAEWIAKHGVSYKATISADKTIPVLPMKDVSDMGLDYGDKVRVIIIKEK